MSDRCEDCGQYGSHAHGCGGEAKKLRAQRDAYRELAEAAEAVDNEYFIASELGSRLRAALAKVRELDPR
jgi:hypothetical protein